MTMHHLPRSERPAAARYRGLAFADQGALDWARALDRLGMHWEWRPAVPLDAGRDLDGGPSGDRGLLAGLPRFLLPASHQVLVVVRQVNCLRLDILQACAEYVATSAPRVHVGEYSPDIQLVLGDLHGRFRGMARSDDGRSIITNLSDALYSCTHCGGSWFLDDSMGWECQCCGAYEGDGHLSDARNGGQLVSFPDVESVPWAA